MTKTLTISAKDDGRRLDLALAEHFGSSRALVQKLLTAEPATINGKKATAHSLVHAGDVVVHAPLPSTRKKAIATAEIPILFEDKDLIVIEKPAGIIVHPMNDTDRRTSVIGSLVKTHPKLKKIGENKLRPGIVHRLDKDVSGVMAVAASQNMFEDLKEQFAERTVEKEYIALVYGKLPKDHDAITFKIARSKTLGRMVSRPEGQEGKEAHTEYDVIAQYKTCALVKVVIKTGRTHQIRTHFKAIGHPVVGDTLYHTKIVHIRPMVMDRLFLHAHKLTVALADGTRKTFVSELPDDLKALLETLPIK